MEPQKPYIAMLFIQLVYAGMALFSKAAIGAGMNPFVFVVYRQAFASLALTPFSIFLERNFHHEEYSSKFVIFFLLFRITLSLNLYYVGLNYTSATVATATTNTIPVITFIIAAFFRMESISVKHFYGVAKVFGTVICLSGALMVALYKGHPAKFMNWNPSSSSAHHHQTGQVSNDPSSISSMADSVKGTLIMLSANAAWSLWLILQGSIMKIYPAKIHLTTLQCWFSCIQSLIVAIIFERNPSSWKLGWNIHLLSVAYCGIVVTGITYWLQAWCIERKGPVFIALFTPLSLIITAIFSAFLWKEQTLHWGSVGGAVLLVGGLYCVLWGKNKEEVITSTDRIEQIDDEEANKEGIEQTGEAKEVSTLECIINTHK
ncbi:Drug/metabolite transporter [Macleaya cordata]|uniref:WAT1-related protein n=1 Tax=Macleaya cordata TaxID=56857 RepID=A0A200QCQ4_MACCD|nr:Drug/metabolite transporter [Macleaya cordata]